MKIVVSFKAWLIKPENRFLRRFKLKISFAVDAMQKPCAHVKSMFCGILKSFR